MTDTETLREEVKHYIDLVDDKSLRIVKAILEIELEEHSEEEDWESLPEELRMILNKAVDESEQGKTTPHEEVVKKYSKWFRK